MELADAHFSDIRFLDDIGPTSLADLLAILPIALFPVGGTRLVSLAAAGTAGADFLAEGRCETGLVRHRAEGDRAFRPPLACRSHALDAVTRFCDWVPLGASRGRYAGQPM